MGEKHLFLILAFLFCFIFLCQFTPDFFFFFFFNLLFYCLQVKRRRRVNGEVSKIFHHIKTHKQQPGRQLFCLPSGLATFTSFALRSESFS